MCARWTYLATPRRTVADRATGRGVAQLFKRLAHGEHFLQIGLGLAGALDFQVAYLGRIDAGLAMRADGRCDLRGAAQPEERTGVSAMPDGGTGDHGMNDIAIAERPRQWFQ